MKLLQYIILLFVFMPIVSCNSTGNTKNENNIDNAGSNTMYKTISDAAQAAKIDMLAIIDSVPLGFDKNMLSSSVPGDPIPSFNIDFKHFIKSDGNLKFESLPKIEFPTIVPFITKNNNNIVTVVSVHNRGGLYTIGQLVNYPLSLQLNSVMARNTANGATLQGIIEVYAIQARVFVATQADSLIYYYGFNNNNTPTNALSGRALLDTLKKESIFYLNKFGDGDKTTFW